MVTHRQCLVLGPLEPAMQHTPAIHCNALVPGHQLPLAPHHATLTAVLIPNISPFLPPKMYYPCSSET